MEEPRFVWKDGRIVPWADAVMHITASAAAEGRTVFEELRCYRDEKSGKTYAFRLGDHIERLRRAVAASMLGRIATSRKLVRAVAETVAANGFEECCIRMSAACRGDILGLSGDSVSADDSAEVTIVCWRERPIAEEPAEHRPDDDGESRPAGPVRLPVREASACVSTWRMGAADSAQPQIRSTAMGGLVALSRREARSRGADEAVILDAAGLVCHSTCGNVFVVRDGVLSTPPLSSGTCDGVMRDAVLNLAMDMDIPAIEEQLTRTDLYMADEAFLADDIAGIVPMASVDSRAVGKGRRGAVTEALQKRFDKASVGKLPEYAAWLTEVSACQEGGE